MSNKFLHYVYQSKARVTTNVIYFQGLLFIRLDYDVPASGGSVMVKVCDKRGDSAATSLNQLLFQAIGAETVTVTVTVSDEDK